MQCCPICCFTYLEMQLLSINNIKIESKFKSDAKELGGNRKTKKLGTVFVIIHTR